MTRDTKGLNLSIPPRLSMAAFILFLIGQFAPGQSVPTGARERELRVGQGEWAVDATLTLPLGKGHFPAVLLVPGSGMTDRDVTIGRNKIFRDLAWGLASRGIVVLRAEKRLSQHADKFRAQHIPPSLRTEFIDDAITATHMLQSMPEVDSKRVYVFTLWEHNALTQLKASTQPPIRSQVKKWLRPYFGKCNMKNIGGQMVQMFVQDTNLSVKSRLNLVRTLRMMWNSAKAWNYVTHDPFDGLVLPDYDPPEQPHRSTEEVKQIIALAKPPFNVVFWLIAETGIRRGEVCALNIGHVDVPNRIIVVRNSRFGKHITPNKSRRPRAFSLSPQLALALAPLVNGKQTDAPLFVSRKGKRLNPDNFVKRELKPILKTLGLDGALHAFRHGNATALDQMNAPLKVRQERLGHVAANTTMGYTHLVSEDDRLLSEKLGEILCPNVPKLETERLDGNVEGLLIQ